ncbi:MAG TPA: 5-(carboxyamino)imidazole ribonucleotide synthase [Candidatus Saccharimonadales bacterium]|nr:5-(carboxyamino)imidazole ribonucleotide synthase [Candidatus Saccharimonadales bacterium]
MAADESAREAPIPPGSTIGILGGGQLGRMLALAARPLGYRIAILDPDPACPAAAVADRQFVAGYGDRTAALDLAAASDVVTYELEHVSAEAVAAIQAIRPVRPGLFALATTQDRLAERRFVASLGIPTAPWREVRTREEVGAATAELGAPLRLKVAIGGYDGRSQARIGQSGDLDSAWAALAGAAEPAGLLLERELDFSAEISVVIARDLAGRMAAYPVTRNRHDSGILIESAAPAPGPRSLAPAAVAIAERIATGLDAVGVVTVELFVLQDGSLAVNEIAPRVHNSGHWTIEGARTSQFEQHVRAICGLPLGSVEPLTPGAAMVNLLGTGPNRPAALEGLEQALRDPGVSVHLYDKRWVFERRKMGHVTVIADSLGEASRRARTAAARLRWAASDPSAPAKEGRTT